MRTRSVLYFVVGTSALIAWIALFSGGLTIETIGFRALLAPHEYAEFLKSDTTPVDQRPTSSIMAFIVTSLWFTPTNLAFLALAAGLLGGCASKLHVQGLGPAHLQIDVERLKYLDESPWASMLRAFIVYLCIIAGMYVIVSDPFKDSTPGQYAKLAGTVSILGLLVGYDPTRIRAWLSMIPSPPSQKVTVKEGDEGGLEIEAIQGPAVGSHDGHQAAIKPR